MILKQLRLSFDEIIHSSDNRKLIFFNRKEPNETFNFFFVVEKSDDDWYPLQIHHIFSTDLSDKTCPFCDCNYFSSHTVSCSFLSDYIELIYDEFTQLPSVRLEFLF